MNSIETNTQPASTTTAAPRRRLTAHALILGERIDTLGLERSDVISTVPLAFRVGNGFAVLFRYGVAVLVGLSPIEEDETIRGLGPRIIGSFDRMEDESATIEIAPDQDDQIEPSGLIKVKDLSPERLVVIADALAKNVALAHDEREVSRVFDVIDPLAARLAQQGRTPGRRGEMLKLIGQALLVRHRMSGRVEVEEKPDVLWDRWDLERLHARLADEYELKERAGMLSRKIEVVGETARALTDLIDAARATRLEVAIVLLIVVEVLFTLYEFVKQIKLFG
ncbi:RMD1 family protein [Pseudorhodoplanes sinuspersici]|uniref:Uncharacterized protein n=1 Tax=Pseudorhodoplanes sinuspersici TaxID=1235591 RepID=A0A1W6ZSC3_9HYPH|nr:RMD1 family protein [Pseudorhodoplanes sinuspersici]ARQ00178.1 hypothetical protein CAK95_14645 [Pseudorhodoplanes sinuspersici]RKE67688.1 YagE family uncharacterized protein [Pseudorhodoplanes sinuspersici]